MSILEELLKNKEEIIVKVLELLGGKEAKTRINLDAVNFNLGRFEINLSGEVEVSVSQGKKKK